MVKFKKRILSVIFGAVFSLSALPVSAMELDTKNSVIEDVSNEYLNAIINKDINSILKLSKEESIISEDDSRKEVIEALNNPNMTLKDFEILSIEKQNNDTYNVNCKLYYNNDKITEEILTVKSNSTETFILLKDDVSIKTIEKGENIPVITPRVQLTSWYVTLSASDGDVIKYSNSFSANVDYVHLNLKQSGSLEYTIVQKQWVGYKNVSWTGTASYNNWDSSSRELYLNKIPGESFDNCKLKIQMKVGGTTSSFGEIYAY